MRFLLLSVVIVACSTDTFTGDDGGRDDAATDGVAPVDAISNTDAKTEAAPAFDPSSLGANLVLWLDANDAKVGDAGDLVASWPDRQSKYTTVIHTTGSAVVCTGPGIHVGKEGKINHSVVTFCNANLGVTDAASLHLGTSAFFVSAVIAPAQSTGVYDVLFTKTPPGDSNAVPSYLTIAAPESANRMQGWINGTASAYSQNSLAQEFQYVTFVRDADKITSRVNGAAGTPGNVSSSDDVSNAGAEVGIGGYRFDLGIIKDVFHGELAELAIVSDPQFIGPIETYLKKKYGL